MGLSTYKAKQIKTMILILMPVKYNNYHLATDSQLHSYIQKFKQIF